VQYLEHSMVHKSTGILISFNPAGAVLTVLGKLD
jgi:hypothetical protein